MLKLIREATITLLPSQHLRAAEGSPRLLGRLLSGDGPFSDCRITNINLPGTVGGAMIKGAPMVWICGLPKACGSLTLLELVFPIIFDSLL